MEKIEDTIDDTYTQHLKNVFQDCNINFLIGSGLSVPFFGTLGKIEEWLTNLEVLKNLSIDDEQYLFVKASLYNAYFNVAMKDNLKLLNFENEVIEYQEFDSKDSEEERKAKKLNNTFLNYKDFLKTLNYILYERRSNTVSKQVNLFTTNIDIFLERTLEYLDLHFNDGFNGIFNKKFSLSNFKKSFYQKSLHYDNISEIPVFNLLKVHGSVTWEMMDDNIYFSQLSSLKSILKLQEKKESIFIPINELNNKKWDEKGQDLTIDEIINELEKYNPIPDLSEFLSLYEKLQIINPTKEKFKDTTFNKTYYELLRLYANELEKESTILFVMGFSMADEHIREITTRALKSNPTLKVFFVPYMQNANDIKSNLKTDKIDLDNIKNIELINPEDKFTLQKFNEKVLFPLLQSIKNIGDNL